MRRIISTFAATLALLSALLLATVSHVGAVASSVNITVEPASGSYAAGSSQTFSIYATPVGGGVYSVEFTINLTNLSYASHNFNGTPFPINVPVGGTTAGSKTPHFIDSYTGTTDGTGKQLLVNLTVTAGSAGSASIAFSGLSAYSTDSNQNLVQIPVTPGSGSYTVTSPSTPPPAPTPPPPGPSPSPTPPSPNPSSSPSNPVKVPTSTTPAPGQPQETVTMSQEEFVAAGAGDVNASPTDEATQTAAVAKKKTNYSSTAVLGLVGLAALAVLFFFGRILWINRPMRMRGGNDVHDVAVTGDLNSTVLDNTPSTTNPTVVNPGDTGSEAAPGTVIKPEPTLPPKEPPKV